MRNPGVNKETQKLKENRGHEFAGLQAFIMS